MDLNRKVDPSAYTAVDMPEYPARTLTTHVLVKGLQMGSTLGVLVLTPIVVFIRKTPFVYTWRRITPITAMAGALVSGSLLAAKSMQPHSPGSKDAPMDVAGVDDRAYRIAQNAGQVRMDQLSLLGGMCGGAVGAVLLRGAVAASAASGIALGVLYFAAEASGIVNEVKKTLNLPTDPVNPK